PETSPLVLPAPLLAAIGQSSSAGPAVLTHGTPQKTDSPSPECTAHRGRMVRARECAPNRPPRYSTARSIFLFLLRPRGATSSHSPSTDKTGNPARPFGESHSPVARATGVRGTNSENSKIRRFRNRPPIPPAPPAPRAIADHKTPDPLASGAGNAPGKAA